MPFADPQKQREYDRLKYLRSRDEYLLKAKADHALNREKRCQGMLERYYAGASVPARRIHMLARMAVARAIRRGIIFDFDIVALLSKNPPGFCPLCRKSLDYSTGRGTGKDSRLDSPSIDRRVPALGYTITNVWVICAHCNGRKWTFPVDSWDSQFIERSNNYGANHNFPTAFLLTGGGPAGSNL